MGVAKQRDRVLPRMIEDEMKQSFLDYSMSVIVQRALPDVRDGLKPVHRRILYAMHEAGLSPTRPYKKSATVVGEVLGKYHPHGDAAVYDSLVRMVQEFSLRYPLIDGQGNFGSIDGDSAAAYRYTEARLAAIAGEILHDIEKDTVDFRPNFDDRLEEPEVLPGRLPNLLVNGSSGIAVGMSTNIPPHNLREIVRAALYLLDHPDCTLDRLMKFVPGPDFPTGGLIIGTEGIRSAYETGRGRVIMRARIVKEQRRGGKEQLVVTELPYGSNKTRIVEQIADLVRKDKIRDISDLRDESDRDGIRVVVELKRGAKADPVLKGLYKWTHLQSTFGVISLALDHGVPREFPLKAMLEAYRDHRVEVVVRRSRWELERAREEAHVLEGMLIALDNIDRVVKLIRGSSTREEAGGKLRSEFELSERQAEAILAMRLYRLVALERQELQGRLDALLVRIAELQEILDSPERQLEEIRAELRDIESKYGDARRTAIVEGDAKLTLEDLTAQEDVVVTVSHEGFIKQIPMSLYRRRVNAGKALAGMERYETDYLEHVFVATTHDTLMFFSSDGQAYWLPVLDIPEAGRASRGKALHQLLGLDAGMRIAAMLTVRDLEEGMLVFATEGGMVKRTALDEFSNPRSGGINAINLKEGDRLIDVQLSGGGNDVVLVTRGGRAIRFQEDDVSQMGRAARGVTGVKLRGKDTAVGMVLARRETALCTVTERGFAKRTALTEFSVQKRGGLGNVAMEVGKKTGDVIGAKELLHADELMLISASGGATRITADQVPEQKRNSQGAQVLKLPKDDRIVEVTRVATSADDDDAAATPAGGSAGEEDDEDLESELGEDAADVLRAGGDASAEDEDGESREQYELIGE